jgi:hypothetical protein
MKHVDRLQGPSPLGGGAGQWCTRTRRCPRQGCETSFYQSQTAPITAAPAIAEFFLVTRAHARVRD